MTAGRRRGFFQRHRVAIATGVVPLLAASALVYYAVNTKGNPPREAHLNDSGVWVSTDQTSGGTGTPAMFGEINVPASQFAASLTPSSGTTGLDILQDDNAVAGLDGQGDLIPVDPSGLRLDSGDQIKIADAQVAIGGDDRHGSIAVLDPVKGSLWATSFDASQALGSLAAVDPSTAKPAAAVGAQSSVAVGDDGSVYAVSPKQGLTTLIRHGATWTTHVTRLPSDTTGTLTVTAVGSQPVVLSVVQGSDTPALIFPGGKVVPLTHLAPGGAVLQQPGPDADQVLVATGSELLAVPFNGGNIERLAPGAGTPAQPVYFEQCAFGAWSGPQPTEVRSCEGKAATKPLMNDGGTAISSLVFREDHEELLLNDRNSGQVWNDPAGSPEQIADWQAVQRPVESKQIGSDNTASNEDKSKSAVANADSLGARPGRSSILHVLDNDKSPNGTVLTVNSVSDVTSSEAVISVAPDKQSVIATLPATASGTFTFMYNDSDGNGKVSNSAKVTVTVVPFPKYFPPELRSGLDREPHFSVPINGVLTIPVLADWRVNQDGDPPALAALDSASVHARGASAIATSDGSIVYTAGKNPGSDTVTFSVVDGDQSTRMSISITVEDRTGPAVPPVAHNDFVQATVGQAVTFDPLDNDLPGSDPLTADATLRIAGVIKAPSGLTIDPPTADGSVTLTASVSGDYKLSYADSYGSVNSTPAIIRVVAGPADPHAKVVAAPDSVTVRGQSPALLDPITNDSSPLGNLLTVVGVDLPQDSNLEVAVVGGRYLRVNVRQAPTTPTTEAFTYTVTDGVTTATAQVTVVELQALTDDVPVAETDFAVVRAGDAVTIPVLDNDIDPGGDALSLVNDVKGAPAPGQLVVTGAGIAGAALGSAFVSGDTVRYVAPAANPAVTQQQQVSIAYVARNGTGQTATGTAIVTIHPRGPVSTDQAPTPTDLEARVVAGGTVVIPVPTSGVDPDGDTVQVQGLGLPARGDPQPTRGALIAFSANSLTYQAYPAANNAGTDTFTYVVTDTYGLSGRATVRVAVVQPTVLPPPVAHDIDLTAAPGSTLDLDVVTPQNVDYPDGAPPTLSDPALSTPDHKSIASLDPTHTGWLKIQVPTSSASGVVSVPYSVVGDLGSPSGATINIQLQPGYDAPPVAVDEFAKPKPGATSVTVKLLAGDYSPTGSALSIKPRSGVSANELTVPLTGVPQVIPFVVIDASGATATADAYIPATGTGSTPYWNGNTISIPASKPTLISIAKYVVDPAGATLQLTDRKNIWASPSLGLTSAITGLTTIQLTGGTGYQGPASVTFAVTRTGSLNDFTLITIPVLVGNPTPVLRCPTDVVQVEQGLVAGSAISPASQCHVWTPPSVDPDSLRFKMTWAKAPGLVDIRTNDAFRDVLFAQHDAKPGSTGVLTISIDGYASKSADLNVVVVAAPQITVSPIDVQGILTTGTPTVINLASYVNSPFGFSAVSIVSFGQIPNVQITKVAPGTLRFVATKRELNGTEQLHYVVTDLTNLNDPSRHKNGIITLQFIGVPGQPTAVTPRPGFESYQVPLTWVAPAPNGAPIEKYVVNYRVVANGSGSGQQTCANSGCVITGLHNGSYYIFTVTAYNKAGAGMPSAASPEGKPDTPPLPIASIRASDPQDGSLLVNWSRVSGAGSTDGFSYTLTWSGGVAGHKIFNEPSDTSYTVQGLNNDATETFSIVAANQAGPSPVATSTMGESAGKPNPPTFTSNTFTPTKAADGSAAVTIEWNAVDRNGPGPVTYTLTRMNPDHTDPVQVCVKTVATSCDDKGLASNGQDYVYEVTASNQVFTSTPSYSGDVEISTQPDQMAAPTVTPPTAATPDGTLDISFTTVPSYGKSLAVDCSYTSDGSTPTESSTACPGSPWSGYGTSGGTQDSKDLSGLGNADSVQFVVWEDNGSTQNTAYRYGVASSPSNAQRTNAPPNPPSNYACSLNGDTVVWQWAGPTSLNGRPIDHYTFSGAVSGVTPASTPQASSSEPEDGATQSIYVESVDSAGESSSQYQIPCTDHAPPPPPQGSVTVSEGTATTYTGCPPTCLKVAFSWTALPTGKATVYCEVDNDATLADAFYSYAYTIASTNGNYGGGCGVQKGAYSSVGVAIKLGSQTFQSKFVSWD